jgi:cell division septation protein DedD
MLQSSESETEILLGNKQLLGVFFAVVVLLGVAFAGGYKIGQSAAKKTLVSTPPTAVEEPAASASSSTASSSTAAAASPSGGETHAFPGGSGSGEQPAETSKTASPGNQQDTGAYHPPSGEDEPPLGSTPRHAKATKAATPAPVSAPAANDGGSRADLQPISGQTFLQVAAVGRDEAQAIADVLHKKGFRAHAVPKPGAPKLYRVLIGPIRDSGDLSSTRDSLRRTGFREIFVQRY